MNSKEMYTDYLKTEGPQTYKEKKEVLECITYDPRPGSYYRRIRDVLDIGSCEDIGEEDKIIEGADLLFQKKFADIYDDIGHGRLEVAKLKLDNELEVVEKTLREAKETINEGELVLFNSVQEKELFLLYTGRSSVPDSWFSYGMPWFFWLQSLYYEKKNMYEEAKRAIDRALYYNPVSAEFTLRKAKLSYIGSDYRGTGALEDCLNVVNDADSYYRYIDLVCFVYKTVLNDPFKAERLACYFQDRTMTPRDCLRKVDSECLFFLTRDRVRIKVKMTPFVPVSVCQRLYKENKAVSKYFDLVLSDFFD